MIKKKTLHYHSLTFYFQPLLTISTCFSPKKCLEPVRICMLPLIIFINSVLSFKPLKQIAKLEFYIF